MNDQELMREALLYARRFSTDPSTQNAAIIATRNGDMLCVDANRFPDGVKEIPERWQRPLKYEYVEHAERNAIYKAAKLGFTTTGMIMYCPWFACSSCARAIVQAGIVEAVGLINTDAVTNARWQSSCEIGLTILKEGGVKVRYLSDRFGLEVLRDGKLVEF